MYHISIDPFSFEVACALDRDLSERIGGDPTSKRAEVRLLAVLLALRDMRFVVSEYDGRRVWICFGEEGKRLDESGEVCDEKLQELAAHQIRLKVKSSDMLRSIELSKQYGADLNPNVIIQSWKAVGSIIDYILEGSLRLIGPASPSGLIVEHLTRSTLEQKCYVWFSLGNKACEEPVMVDLEEPLMFEGHARFPINADAQPTADEQLFVTLGYSKR